MPNPLANSTQYFARQRVLSLIDEQKLYRAIDGDPAIVGAGVVWIDSDFNIITLREFKPICSIRPKRLILRETPRHTSPEQYKAQIETGPRESRVISEAFNMTLTCGGAVLGWIAMISGGMAVPFTGGASLTMSVLGYSAAIAGTVQCTAGLVRTGFEMTDPSLNDALDSNDWYNAVSLVLDGISLASAATGAKSTIQFVLARRRATGQAWHQVTKTLSRQQRKALTRELLKLEDPSLTTKQLKLKQAAGELIKHMSASTVKDVTITKIIEAGGSFLGFASSSTVQSVTKGLAVGLYEELAE